MAFSLRRPASKEPELSHPEPDWNCAIPRISQARESSAFARCSTTTASSGRSSISVSLRAKYASPKRGASAIARRKLRAARPRSPATSSASPSRMSADGSSRMARGMVPQTTYLEPQLAPSRALASSKVEANGF